MQEEESEIMWERIGTAWVEGLIGTPRRGFLTFGGVCAIYLLYHPEIIKAGANHLQQNVVIPLLPVVIATAITWGVLKWMWKGVTSSSNKKRRK